MQMDMLGLYSLNFTQATSFTPAQNQSTWKDLASSNLL